MKRLQPISSNDLLYQRIIGTGGIGSGMFFLLQGNETLGREESRMAALLPYKDYCKQHIIMHYISVLLGAEDDGSFQVYPIGKVGNDETGKNLLKQMQSVGMNTGHVKISDQHATMFSVCFQYPDHAGGNITTAESASSAVMPEDIDDFFSVNDNITKTDIILAAPEVPVQTRLRLLEHGRQRGSPNVASLQSSEISDFTNGNGFSLTDMLFINLDEAKKIAHVNEETGAETVVLTSIRNLIDINPSPYLSPAEQRVCIVIQRSTWNFFPPYQLMWYLPLVPETPSLQEQLRESIAACRCSNEIKITLL